MHIKVRLTKQIINECLQLHYRSNPIGKKLKRRLFFVPILLVIISLYLIYKELIADKPGPNLYLGILYIGFAFVYFFFMRHRMQNAGKQLLKSLGPDANFDLEVTDSNIATKMHNSTLTNSWEVFTGALISKDNVLLYQGNSTFVMLNHTFFESFDFEEFKDMTRRNVSPVIEV